MNVSKQPMVDYKTHVLIGVRVNGKMEVIHSWPFVPGLVDVEKQISATTLVYVTFLLCTPTAILPGLSRGLVGPSRPGR